MNTNTIHLDTVLPARARQLSPRDHLEQALGRGQFLLFGQTIRGTEPSRTPLGVEVLLRMKEEEMNLLSPGWFFEVAEKYDMLEAIDRWVLRETVAHAAAYDRAGHALPTTFCVNVSSASLGAPDFATFARTTLAAAGLAQSAICFEIPEAAARSRPDVVHDFVDLLRPGGGLITLESYGGLGCDASLLVKLGVAHVKIDGGLVNGLDRDDDRLLRIRELHCDCAAIGVKTIAESVETPAVLDLLRDVGIDYVQGFGVHRPAPLSDIEIQPPRP